MIENKFTCGEGLQVCKTHEGMIGLRCGLSLWYSVDNATATKLLEWLMQNVTVDCGTTAAIRYSASEAVSVTDTLSDRISSVVNPEKPCTK